MTTKAWAVTDRKNGIVIETVYPTRRGAIVNWLGVIARVQVTNNMSDDFIERLWSIATGDDLLGVQAIEVEIVPIEPVLLHEPEDLPEPIEVPDPEPFPEELQEYHDYMDQELEAWRSF